LLAFEINKKQTEKKQLMKEEVLGFGHPKVELWVELELVVEHPSDHGKRGDGFGIVGEEPEADRLTGVLPVHAKELGVGPGMEFFE
jgi:hypothetical protein